MKINDLSFFLIRESRSQGKLHTELWRQANTKNCKLKVSLPEAEATGANSLRLAKEEGKSIHSEIIPECSPIMLIP